MANNTVGASKKYLMILLLVLAFSLAIGYAVFSDTLTITGTANAKGSFDVNFTHAEIFSSQGINADASDATINDDVLTVVIKDLAYPGAGAQVKAVIQNDGTVPAKITSVTPTGITGNGNAIKITGLDAITAAHPTLEAGKTCTIDFIVSWDENVVTLDNSVEGENDNDNDFSFNLVINYEQDTTKFNGSASHADN